MDDLTRGAHVATDTLRRAAACEAFAARDAGAAPLPLLARPYAWRDSRQALDRNSDTGDRPDHRGVRVEPSDRWPVLAGGACGRRAAGRRNRLRRARHGLGHDRRRHRSFRRLDVRTDEFLRVVRHARSEMAGGSRRADHADLRRPARRNQRRAHRLLPAARLHHHADHADHLPLRLRHADSALFDAHRRRISQLRALGLDGQRRRAGRADDRHRLHSHRHLRPLLHDADATRLAHHRDRRLAPLRLQQRRLCPLHCGDVLRRLQCLDGDWRDFFRGPSRHGRWRYRRRP